MRTFTIGYEVRYNGPTKGVFFAHTASEAVALSAKFGHDKCEIVKLEAKAVD